MVDYATAVKVGLCLNDTSRACDRVESKKLFFVFADIHQPAKRNMAKTRTFADDLSLAKHYATTMKNNRIQADLRRSQIDIHA